MTASGPPPNQLLQMLDAADFDLLRPQLVPVEMVRETVLREAGAALRHVYFPHGGSVSITVGLSDGQMIEIPMLGRDSAVGGGAALADGIAPADAVVLFPGGDAELRTPGLHADARTCRRAAISRHAVLGHIVPIANISLREDDGTYSRRKTGDSLGNDGAPSQRFPVCAVGGRL